MGIPIVLIASPLRWVLQLGWLLITRGGLPFYAFLVLMFAAGALQRLPTLKAGFEAVQPPRARPASSRAARGRGAPQRPADLDRTADWMKDWM